MRLHNMVCMRVSNSGWARMARAKLFTDLNIATNKLKNV